MAHRGVNSLVPAPVRVQLARACQVIEHHVGSRLLAIHLFGSAVRGGLKPASDIDLLVTIDAHLDDSVRQALLRDLLDVSAPFGTQGKDAMRELEVTVVVRDEIIPWRYPARRELQFGEWLRKDIIAGEFEPPCTDIDLPIILTNARERSIALLGPPAEELFDPVPERDFFAAMEETLKLWNEPPDWAGDEPYVVLTLARIWYSAATGKIVPKDVAGNWALAYVPADLRSVVSEAREAYLGLSENRLASRADQVAAFVRFAKEQAGALLRNRRP